MENSERDGNTRPPDLPLEKPICRSGSNHRLVQNRKRSTSRLYIVTLLLCRVNHVKSRLDEAQAIIKFARRNVNYLRYADDTTLMAESKEELESLLMKVKENEKAGLKLNIQRMKIMASCPITSWQIDGGKNGNSDRLYFIGLQNSLWTVTTAMKLKEACSLEEKL